MYMYIALLPKIIWAEGRGVRHFYRNTHIYYSNTIETHGNTVFTIEKYGNTILAGSLSLPYYSRPICDTQFVR